MYIVGAWVPTIVCFAYSTTIDDYVYAGLNAFSMLGAIFAARNMNVNDELASTCMICCVCFSLPFTVAFMTVSSEVSIGLKISAFLLRFVYPAPAILLFQTRNRSEEQQGSSILNKITKRLYTVADRKRDVESCCICLVDFSEQD